PVRQRPMGVNSFAARLWVTALLLATAVLGEGEEPPALNEASVRELIQPLQTQLGELQRTLSEQANKIADLEKARAASEEAATLVAAKSATLEVKLSELTEKAATDTAELQRSLKEEVCPIGAFSEHKAAAAKAVEDFPTYYSCAVLHLEYKFAYHCAFTLVF
ncbi:unnamed protein product, partial [Polarella glacialis]